jgi:hypothetical protein
MSSIANTLVGSSRDVGGDDLDHRFVDDDAVEVDRRHGEVLREEVREALLGDDPHLHEVRAEAPALLLLQGQRVVQLLLADGPRGDQQLPELAHVVRSLAAPSAARQSSATAERE